MANFGEYLKKKRSDKGLSMRELERRSEISQAYISQIERSPDKIPQPDVVRKLAAALGIPSTEMMIVAGHITQDEQQEAKKVPTLREAFGFQPSINAFWERNDEGIDGLSFYSFPVNDINFHLNDSANKKFYKEMVLTDQERKDIEKVIDAYLLHKRISTVDKKEVDGLIETLTSDSDKE